ncbi:MAG: class I mannose-6-phosphate isomerase [Clostridiales bacterium]|nr:class I mannose-6-phosphate isomerase [Clostridiales bacterium]
MPVLKLKPACKDYIWGGKRLKTDYNKEFDGPRLAECWELSCHPDGPSIITNGVFAGRTLREYLAAVGKRVLGSNCQVFQEFPILIKLIDAKDNLSIQVHPNNTDALENEHQYGKTEMWYVLDAEPGAYLYYGFREPISKGEFRQRIQDGTLLEVLNAVPVHKGDLFYIPAGTLHAICKGIVIAEIQQSSNVTYRVFDYNRVGADGTPRKLHVDQAVEVTHCQPPRTDYNFGGHLARSAYFTVDVIQSPYAGDCDDESFTSLLVLEGEGEVRCGKEIMPCRKGDSLFLPADSGEFSITGTISALMTRVGTI